MRHRSSARQVAANSDAPEDRRIVLRIGINLGDVVVEGSDRYGERSQHRRTIGGHRGTWDIAVSGLTYDAVRNKVKAGFEDLGVVTLQNIAEPAHVYRVTGTPRTAASPAASPAFRNGRRRATRRRSSISTARSSSIPTSPRRMAWPHGPMCSATPAVV